MKKWFIALLCLVTTVSFCQKQDAASQKRLAKAKIYSMVVMWYRYDVNGNLLPQGNQTMRESYDKKGRVTSRIAYHADKGIISEWTYKYSKSSNRLLGVIKKNGKGELEEKKKMIYEGNKLMQEESVVDSNKFIIKYTYDTKGNQTSKERVNKNGETEYKITYSFKDTLCTSEVVTGKKNYTTLYEYDANGNRTKERLYRDTTLNYTIEYMYNAKNQMTQEEKFDYLGRSVYTLLHNYNADGQVHYIEKLNKYLGHAESDYKEKKWVYSYDAFGNVLEIKMVDAVNNYPLSLTKHIYKALK